MRRALSVAVADSVVWVGASGGLFSLNDRTNEVRTYTLVDGLHTVTAANVAFDKPRNVVWIGYEDGVLDRLDPESGVIQSFRDIERASQFSSRRINRIRMQGDTLYVATDFGLVVFDPARSEVRDAYNRFGTFSAGIPVFDFDLGKLDDGSPGIWVATDEGVAYAPRSAINLQDPSVWTVEQFISDDPPLSIGLFLDSVYVGVGDGLRVRVGPGIYSPRGAIDRAVTSLQRRADRLIGVSEFRTFQVNEQGTITVIDMPGVSFPTGFAAEPGDSLFWVSDAERGLARVRAGGPDAASMQVTDFFVPPGPRDGLFSTASVGSDGSLLLGGVSGAGRGFYHLKPDGTWVNYNTIDFPALGPRGSFFVVNVDKANGLWAGSAGGGAARVDTTGSIELFTEVNSSLLPVTGTNDFIIVGGIDEDSDNNTWVTTLGSPSPLHFRTQDGTWQGLPPYVGQGLTSLANAYGPVYVDSFDQKWIIVRDESSFSNTRGLMVVDTGDDPADRSDDAFRFYNNVGSGGQGLPSTKVTAIVEDRNGLVWIGTDRGLGYVVNTGFVAQDNNAVVVWPQQADRTQGPFLFLGLPINALAVDPANRLWVATDEGVRIVEATEGGFQEVGAPITVDNSPLPSNSVNALAVEPQTGRVFVVTDGGMVSTQGEAIEPVVEVGDLFVYPNPADLNEVAPEIFIEGLSESSTVTIVGPDGARVRRLEARGGRIRWDGRDSRGQIVPSGMYIVVAVGTNGEGTGYGKVAIIR